MKRTQIYLNAKTYEKAKALAKLRGQTVSELIRISLSQYLPTQNKNYNSLEAILEMAKTFPTSKNTPRDISANIDHYLYGTPKKTYK